MANYRAEVRRVSPTCWTWRIMRGSKQMDCAQYPYTDTEAKARTKGKQDITYWQAIDAGEGNWHD